MNNQAFTPSGQTVLVSTAAVQVPPVGSNVVQATAYRIRCLVTGYLTWSPVLASGVAPTSLTATAPANLVPSTNTVGMFVGQTEVLCLPPNAWFASSVASGFEVTPGEGV